MSVVFWAVTLFNCSDFGLLHCSVLGCYTVVFLVVTLFDCIF